MELVKLFFVIYLASWLSRRGDRQSSFKKGYLPFLIIFSIIAVLLLKQPSTSTVAILLAVSLIMYFVSGAKFRYIGGSILVGAVVLGLVTYFTPYRLERVINFLHSEQNTQTGGYHIEQARIAIGSGGIAGVGYGQSTTKINSLPEPVGDSVFAVIAEELGFIGATGLILVFFALVVRSFMLARRCHDKFGELLLVGFGTLIGVQAFMNIAAISGVIPLTGTPLPFVSYGGTALAIFMTIGGIMGNVSKHT